MICSWYCLVQSAACWFCAVLAQSRHLGGINRGPVRGKQSGYVTQTKLMGKVSPSPSRPGRCDHMTDTGGGGWVDKSKCQASCSSNTTTRDSKEYLGYIGAVVAVLCFGSNFVPVKQYETGDGEGGGAGDGEGGWGWRCGEGWGWRA